MAAAQLGFRTPPQPPHYPPASRARAEEGTTTVLALLVSQGGRAQELKLERSSGYARLDHAALAAAARWEFNPPPAPTWVRVPVRFALTE
jgi:protein TonB